MTERSTRTQSRALGRGLDTIIRDTVTDVPETTAAVTTERVSEIISIRITPRQKEFITLYDKYTPNDESFAETFRKQLDAMDRDLGVKLRELEAEAQALARRILK